jgi:transcription elongation GreA/GreB family factor
MKVDKPPYLFLQKDYNDLAEYMASIHEEIVEIQAGVGFSTSQSSETWHDNIMHEELMRKYAMEEARLDFYKAIQRQSQIVSNNKDLKLAGIGNLVRLEKDGEELEYRIGSYLLIKPQENEVAYSSPLGSIILNTRLGTTVSGEIGGKRVNYKILDVQQ